MTQNQFDTDVWTLLSERYKDFERIGEGGTAVVYKAHDATLNRTVAIKTMSVQRMTPEKVLRFQHEARAASKLQHPNLIRVLDFGLTENDRPYLVMDYVEGKSLEDLLQERDYLSIEETISILLEVCRGMSFAHKNGVVHRDLKPSNILMLSKPEAEARIKVVDFGIAKLSGRDELSDADAANARVDSNSVDIVQKRITLDRKVQRDSKGRTGELMGSPFYMSPEQIKGEDVDERTDVYAIGCILFRMLSGFAPFEGETHLKTYSQHINDLPPQIVDPVLPDEMHALIDKCLAKKPDERPQSMAAVAEALRNVPRKKSVIDASLKPNGAKRRRLSRKRLAAALAICLSLVSLAIYQIYRKPKATQPVVQTPALDPLNAELKKHWELQDHQGDDYWEGSSATSDADVDFLVQAKATNISLRGTSVTNVGLEKLCALPVERLDLTWTKFDDSAVPYIARMTGLRNLTLTNTKITDEGLLGLAPLRSLERLDLDQLGGVTDKGLDTVIKQWPNLIYINLAKTSVTEKGLLRLNELPHLLGLELAELRLSDRVMKEVIGRDDLLELNVNHSEFSRKWVKEIPKMRSLRMLQMSKVPAVLSSDYIVLQKELDKKHCQFQCFDSLNNSLPEVQPLVDLIGNPEP